MVQRLNSLPARQIPSLMSRKKKAGGPVVRDTKFCAKTTTKPARRTRRRIGMLVLRVKGPDADAIGLILLLRMAPSLSTSHVLWPA
jgi:hypothetical protein